MRSRHKTVTERARRRRQREATRAHFADWLTDNHCSARTPRAVAYWQAFYRRAITPQQRKRDERMVAA